MCCGPFRGLQGVSEIMAQHFVRSGASIAFSVALLISGAVQAGSYARDVERHSRQNFQEFLDLLALENIPEEPRNIQRNAAYLKQAFEKRGFEVQLLDNAAKRPAVFAKFPQANPRAKTILFYIHYDGQPVIPAEWSQKSPFEPVVKARDASGQWKEVPRERLFATPLDPELRVFARSASDDKAPIMMFLTAIDLLKAQRKAHAVNIKVILDGEEEIGSPSLESVVSANRALFGADALAILDGPAHESGRATLAFGNRGITQATLTVYGPKAPVHSGHYGNYVPNPAFRLAALLATMKDAEGRVLIPGYYDGIELSTADRAELARTGDDEPALRKRLGIAQAEKVGGNYREATQYPSLNIRGMASAAVADKAANVVPSQAVAELDLRTTPETDGRKLFELIKRHIEAQGYHLTDGAPTDEERARYDKLASFHLGPVEPAARMPMDASVGKWVVAAAKSPAAPNPNIEPVRIRMMGGTVPTDVLVSALKQPFILIPTVNSDNNQHARDENLRIGNFLTGTETIYSLLTTKFPQ
jgi:acetylornithine deacetylase/succinyl-diaminopimelate desuccinylase-like protein